MKIEVMESVETIYGVIQSIDEALAQVMEMQNSILQQPTTKNMKHEGLTSSAPTGEMWVKAHGRAYFVNCYVGDEITEAARDVLLQKRRKCIAYCEAYGIEFDDEFIFKMGREKAEFQWRELRDTETGNLRGGPCSAYHARG